MPTVTSAPEERDDKLRKVIAVAIKIRDKRDEIKREYEDKMKAELEPLNAKYEELSKWIAQRLNEAGSDSLSVTGVGTAFFKTNKKASLVDWAALAGYVRTSGEVDLLEKRVSKSAVEQFIKDNEGEVPPGVRWDVERVLNLRRAPKAN